MVRRASIIARNNAIWLPVRPVFLASPDPPFVFVHRCAVGRSTYRDNLATNWNAAQGGLSLSKSCAEHGVFASA